MANYLLLYYDGETVSNKKLHNRLAAWEEQEIGNALVDNGATFDEHDTKAVKEDHSIRPPKDKLKGFSIIKANSLSEALEISSGAPILREGGKVAVYKTDRSGD